MLDTGAGTIAYTPATDYVGADSFAYTVSDNFGGTCTPTVNVTVTSASVSSPNMVIPPAYDSGSGTFSVTFAGIPGYTYPDDITNGVLKGDQVSSWPGRRTMYSGSPGPFGPLVMPLRLSVRLAGSVDAPGTRRRRRLRYEGNPP